MRPAVSVKLYCTESSLRKIMSSQRQHTEQYNMIEGMSDHPGTSS